MALFKPDFDLIEAKQIIDNMDSSREGRLIKYYIKKQQDLIDEQRKDIEEYVAFFNKLNRFLPNKY